MTPEEDETKRYIKQRQDLNAQQRAASTTHWHAIERPGRTDAYKDYVRKWMNGSQTGIRVWPRHYWQYISADSSTSELNATGTKYPIPVSKKKVDDSELSEIAELETKFPDLSELVIEE